MEEREKETPVVESAKTLPRSQAGFLLSRVTRTEAYALGVKIFDPATRLEMTP